MTKCIVKNCHSVTGTDRVKLHGFPCSIPLIKLWLQQTGNIFSDIDVFAESVLRSRKSGLYQICSKHFSPKSYIFNGTEMVLKPDAIPTIFGKVQKTHMEDDIFMVSPCKDVEVVTCVNPVPPQPRVQTFSPLIGHRVKDMCTEDSENIDFRGTKHDSTFTAKLMVDKSIGTDPYNDISDSQNEKLMNKRLLTLAMEIISLLTGEEYMMVKKNCSRPTSPLTGEVPIKCGDVSIYFSMEEWDYIEDHKDHYQNVMENEERSSNPSSPAEPEVPADSVTTVLDTEEQDDTQSIEDVEEVDLSADTSEDEFNAEVVSSGQAIEEPYAVTSWEAPAVHEDTCADEFKSRDLQGESCTMACSPDETVEDNKTNFHISQVEDSGENFPAESPRHVIENFVYTSTFDQCEDQSWTAYDKFVGDANCLSKEHPQIKEESSQYNYTFEEEPAYVDNLTRVCEERSQLFETMNNLLVHQITHGQSSSADKPYACSHCEKRFAKRSHLGMHLKTHTGEKPYACPDCGKLFSRRSNMATHYRTHTGEKPFACPKCGKRFTQSSHMVTHQRTHTTDKLFTCPECRKCFTKWSYLNFHLRTHGIEKLSVP
ncbi:zinc finger protein 436-like isoform X2 [Pseudophryne corroboree]|uniref:zinc finger protein 436-like isoform X2 n=1 Tax=Pseudophryne corroboree TaxID=495146 RepID=UPI0030817933